MDNVTLRATAIIGATSLREWVEEVLRPAFAKPIVGSHSKPFGGSSGVGGY